MDGFLLIDKESGITSYGVINKLKKVFPGVKIGHTGTLDPNTTGLLVIALGKATKILPMITENSKKTYQSVMLFGIKTDSGDITGEVIGTDDENIIDPQKVKEIMYSFIKKYNQVPPKYSAKKIDGKRAYKKARENQDIDMSKSAKEVEILNIDILSIEGKEVEFITKVSKGCYIRSLIEDIAQELRTVATMKSLIRLETDGFDLKDAKKIEDITKEDVITLDKILLNIYEKQIFIEGKIAHLIKNGVRIENENIISKFDKIMQRDKILFLDKDTGKIIALYEYKEKLNPLVIFWR